MILTANLVQRLSTTKSFIWRQNFHIMASCTILWRHRLFSTLFVDFQQASNVHQDLDYFKTLFWDKKIFLIFFFLPFFSMKDCYEIEINIFSVQNIASVNFQKVCCSTRSSSQTKVRKTWSLVVVVMSAILQRCRDWTNEIYNYCCELNNLNL